MLTGSGLNAHEFLRRIAWSLTPFCVVAAQRGFLHALLRSCCLRAPVVPIARGCPSPFRVVWSLRHLAGSPPVFGRCDLWPSMSHARRPSGYPRYRSSGCRCVEQPTPCPKKRKTHRSYRSDRDCGKTYRQLSTVTGGPCGVHGPFLVRTGSSITLSAELPEPSPASVLPGVRGTRAVHSRRSDSYG
jgi:hypothetical protein